MSFKGQTVWVRVDDNGKPVLDGGGRAEMKYRETDEKVYKPSPANLQPQGDGPAPAPAHAPRPAARHPSEPRARAAAASPARPAAPSVSHQGTAASGTIHVWTDGACSGNPGPMGIGVVVIAGDKRKEHGEYLGQGTNNIAELTAIERGLEIAETLCPGNHHAFRVYTDSSYSIGLLQQGWKAKANQALVARLKSKVSAYPNLRLVKVAGHAGVPENERCDLLARQAVACRPPGK